VYGVTEKENKKRKRKKTLLQRQKEIVVETNELTLYSWRLRHA
jgi:hypothetical protein